jgi:hypothetical protein
MIGQPRAQAVMKTMGWDTICEVAALTRTIWPHLLVLTVPVLYRGLSWPLPGLDAANHMAFLLL